MLDKTEELKEAAERFKANFYRSDDWIHEVSPVADPEDPGLTDGFPYLFLWDQNIDDDSYGADASASVIAMSVAHAREVVLSEWDKSLLLLAENANATFAGVSWRDAEAIVAGICGEGCAWPSRKIRLATWTPLHGQVVQFSPGYPG
mgnify:FL=1